MPKEFNIDDYQYTEEHLGYSEWARGYLPKANHVNSAAKFGGLLFEHQGPEWDFIVRQPNQQQWTLIRDDEGQLLIRNGLAVKGRLGYFFTEHMHNSHATILVKPVPESELDRAACGI
jgi:hypothetical protein